MEIKGYWKDYWKGACLAERAEKASLCAGESSWSRIIVNH